MQDKIISRVKIRHIKFKKVQLRMSSNFNNKRYKNYENKI